MKNAFRALLAGAAVITAGCGTDYYPSLEVIHASSNAPEVTVNVNGENLLTDVDYKDAPGVLSLPSADTYDITVLAELPDGSTLPVIELDPGLFDTDVNHMVVAIGNVGDEGDTALQAKVLSRPLDPLATGTSRVTVLHGAAGAPAVDVYVTAPGTDLNDETPLNETLGIDAVSFGDSLDPQEIPAGDYQVRLTVDVSETIDDFERYATELGLQAVWQIIGGGTQPGLQTASANSGAQSLDVQTDNLGPGVFQRVQRDLDPPLDFQFGTLGIAYYVVSGAGTTVPLENIRFEIELLDGGTPCQIEVTSPVGFDQWEEAEVRVPLTGCNTDFSAISRYSILIRNTGNQGTVRAYFDDLTLNKDETAIAFDSGPFTLTDGEDVVAIAVDNTNAGPGSIPGTELDVPVSVLLVSSSDASPIEVLDTQTGTEVRATHAIADAGLVDVYVDGQLVDALEDLDYTQVRGPLALPADDYVVQVAQADTMNFLINPDGDAAALDAGVYYDLIATGSIADMNQGFTIGADDRRRIVTAAKLRVIHGAAGVDDVDLYIVDSAVTDITDVDPFAEDIPFQFNSGFFEVAEGRYNIYITPADSKTIAIAAVGVVLSDSGIYTAIARDADEGEAGPGLILLDDFVDVSIIDDFERYVTEVGLQAVWSTPGGIQPGLQTASANSGAQSLDFQTDGLGPGVAQRVERELDPPLDFQFGTLGIAYYVVSGADTTVPLANIRVEIELNDGGTPCQIEVTSPVGFDQWEEAEVRVPLTGCNADLSAISRYSILIRNTGNLGTVRAYFDDLTLTKVPR